MEVEATDEDDNDREANEEGGAGTGAVHHKSAHQAVQARQAARHTYVKLRK